MTKDEIELLQEALKALKKDTEIQLYFANLRNETEVITNLNNKKQSIDNLSLKLKGNTK